MGAQLLHLAYCRSENISWHVNDISHRSLATPSPTAPRQLARSGGGRISGRKGGGRENTIQKRLSVGSLFFYITITLIMLFMFCCFLKMGIRYRDDGGSTEAACRDTCMMLRFFGCGRCWFTLWLIRRCGRCCGCPRRRYRTMPEPSSEEPGSPGTPPDARASRTRTSDDLPSAANVDGGMASMTSHQVVVGREVREAQAQTAVSRYEPPRKGAETDSAMTECIICLEPFAEGNALRTLPCLHRYHMSCIDNWLTTNLSCPLCKSVISSRAVIVV